MEGRRNTDRTEDDRVRETRIDIDADGDYDEFTEEGGWTGQRTEAVDKMITEFEERFLADDFKANVGDYIRLVQVRRELGDEQPREVQVSWRDSTNEVNVSA